MTHTCICIYAHLYISVIQLNTMHDCPPFTNIQAQHIVSIDKHQIFLFPCDLCGYLSSSVMTSCLLSPWEALSILISCFCIRLVPPWQLLLFKSSFSFLFYFLNIVYNKLLTFSNWCCRSSSLDFFMKGIRILPNPIYIVYVEMYVVLWKSSNLEYFAVSFHHITLD